MLFFRFLCLQQINIFTHLWFYNMQDNTTTINMTAIDLQLVSYKSYCKCFPCQWLAINLLVRHILSHVPKSIAFEKVQSCQWSRKGEYASTTLKYICIYINGFHTQKKQFYNLSTAIGTNIDGFMLGNIANNVQNHGYPNQAGFSCLQNSKSFQLGMRCNITKSLFLLWYLQLVD